MSIRTQILKCAHDEVKTKMEIKRKKKDTCKNICNVLRGDLFWKKRFFMNILDGNAFMGLEI